MDYTKGDNLVAWLDAVRLHLNLLHSVRWRAGMVIQRAGDLADTIARDGGGPSHRAAIEQLVQQLDRIHY